MLIATLWPLSEETKRSLFEEFLGVPLTPQINMVSLERSGGFDFFEMKVCFEAPKEVLHEIVVAKSLNAAKHPSSAPGCLPHGEETFELSAGAGSGGDPSLKVHGFYSSEQTLIYDPET